MTNPLAMIMLIKDLLEEALKHAEDGCATLAAFPSEALRKSEDDPLYVAFLSVQAAAKTMTAALANMRAVAKAEKERRAAGVALGDVNNAGGPAAAR